MTCSDVHCHFKELSGRKWTIVSGCDSMQCIYQITKGIILIIFDTSIQESFNSFLTPSQDHFLIPCYFSSDFFISKHKFLNCSIPKMYQERKKKINKGEGTNLWFFCVKNRLLILQTTLVIVENKWASCINVLSALFSCYYAMLSLTVLIIHNMNFIQISCLS